MVYWDFLVANTSGFSGEIWAFPVNERDVMSAGAARRPDLPEMWHGASRLGAPALPKRHGGNQPRCWEPKKSMGSPRFPRVSHYLYHYYMCVLNCNILPVIYHNLSIFFCVFLLVITLYSMYLNVTCMHTCIHHGDHDWWTLVTHVRSLEWVSELIMIWHVLSLRDVRSRWLTLLTAFRYTLIYTDWLHHGPARWSLMFHPRFYHVPGQTCMNDRSIYCCESHDLSNRNLHWLPGLHPVPRQATTTKQPKRCRLDAQKSPTRCFFCGVGGHYEGIWRAHVSEMYGPYGNSEYSTL